MATPRLINGKIYKYNAKTKHWAPEGADQKANVAANVTVPTTISTITTSAEAERTARRSAAIAQLTKSMEALASQLD